MRAFSVHFFRRLTKNEMQKCQNMKQATLYWNGERKAYGVVILQLCQRLVAKRAGFLRLQHGAAAACGCRKINKVNESSLYKKTDKGRK